MLKENIKAFRRAKGMSQEALASKLNVVRQTIPKWEQGLSVPDSEMLVALSAVLETPVSVLLGETAAAASPEDLTALSEKLENINMQLAWRKILRRRVVIGLLAAGCAALIITFAVLVILDSPYLAWDDQSLETAVVGVAFHAFEWVFVRAAPFMLAAALAGLWLARKFFVSAAGEMRFAANPCRDVNNHTKEDSPVNGNAAPALGSRKEKRAFYKNALWIMLPIAFQNLMDTAVNSADVIMLSYVSQDALGASSLAGQVYFIMSNLIYGLSSASAVMAAQYWGKGDRRTVEKVLGVAVRIALLVSLPFALAAALVPGQVMRIFTPDPALIAEGEKYLRAVSASYVLGAFAQIYLSVMRSVERVMTTAIVHCCAVGMNVVLNACFIFGWGPFPQLGIVGVALATSITRAVEAIVCVIDGTLCRRITLRLKDIVARGGALVKDFLHIAIPAASNDIIWGLAFSVYSIILGHLSSDIVAANSVATVVRNLGTVACFGTASAAGIVLGKTMGENKLEEAKAYAKRFIGMAVWTALFGGAVILLVRPFVLDFMHLSVKDATQTAKDYLGLMLYINAYYIMGMSLNTMLICGIFRAGGDVRYGLICDTLAMWGYAVPVGLLCAFVFKLPEMWVYFILCLDEFVKLPVNFWYYRKRRWLKNITRDEA